MLEKPFTFSNCCEVKAVAAPNSLGYNNLKLPYDEKTRKTMECDYLGLANSRIILVVMYLKGMDKTYNIKLSMDLTNVIVLHYLSVYDKYCLYE